MVSIPVSADDTAFAWQYQGGLGRSRYLDDINCVVVILVGSRFRQLFARNGSLSRHMTYSKFEDEKKNYCGCTSRRYPDPSFCVRVMVLCKLHLGGLEIQGTYEDERSEMRWKGSVVSCASCGSVPMMTNPYTRDSTVKHQVKPRCCDISISLPIRIIDHCSYNLLSGVLLRVSSYHLATVASRNARTTEISPSFLCSREGRSQENDA